MAERTSNQELEHPALHHLAVTPDIIQDLMEGLSEEQALAKKQQDEFSLAEFLEYMSHIEAHHFRAALDRIMTATPGASESAANEVTLEPYDREALFAAGIYSGREPEESLAHWQERRDDNIEALEGLKETDLTRRARHPELGLMTLDALLRAWAAHDLRSIQQIAAYVSRFLYTA